MIGASFEAATGKTIEACNEVPEEWDAEEPLAEAAS